jgi:hypothetical protein
MLTFFVALGALLATVVVLGLCAIVATSIYLTIRKQIRES